MDVSACNNSPKDNKRPGITNSVKYAEHTDSGTLGDATKGTAEKGKICVERGVERIVDYIQNFLEK